MHAKRITSVLLAVFSCALLASQQGAPAPVTILLKDQSGRAIRQVAVRVIPAPEPAPKMETDENGKLALQLKPGGYALFASVAGFKPLAAHLEVRASAEAQTMPFVLEVAPAGSPQAVVDASAKADLKLLASPYHDPTGLTLAQLKGLPHIMVTFHNSHTNADETYSGVRVADILAPLGAPLGKELHGIALMTCLVATGSDGYQAVLALAEVDPSFHPGEVIVADAMNGKALDEHNGPLKLVLTEDKRPARSVRNLVSIEVKTL
jgi:hypothetical protein